MTKRSPASLVSSSVSSKPSNGGAGFFLLRAFAVAGARTESRSFFETGLLVSVSCVPLKA